MLGFNGHAPVRFLLKDMPRFDEHDPKNAELVIRLDVPTEYILEFIAEWDHYMNSLIEMAGPITQATLTLPADVQIIELDHY